MEQRSRQTIQILVAFALGVLLTFLCLSQGWFILRDDSASGDVTNAVQNERHETIGVETERKTHLLTSSAGTPDRLSHDEDGSLDRLPADLASMEMPVHQEPREGLNAEATSSAAGPVANPGLVAGKTAVKQTDHGPVARFGFTPMSAEPVGPVMIVAFLPPGSAAKIRELSPAGQTDYSETRNWISEDGWFAAFQGTPGETTNLQFDLSVSQPAIATIKGSCGIEPFEIDLRPGR